jgi:hypothetical protein
MAGGTEASAQIAAAALSYTSIKIGMLLGPSRASIFIALSGSDSRGVAAILRKSSTHDSAGMKGLSSGYAGRYSRRSNLALGSLNTVELRITPGRLEVLVNHATTMVADVPAPWNPQSYSVGFRDGDSVSTVRSFVVKDRRPSRIPDGGRVACLPQLAQPSRSLSARQPTEAHMPSLVMRSMGAHPALLFDGRSQSLITEAAADAASLTVVAVVRSDPQGGSIIGPNESAGGLQIKVDVDGSVVALNAGQCGIARSSPGAVGDSPAIVAFSLDSVGNAQFYINGRPDGAEVSQVKFPTHVTLAIGSSYNAEFFSGFLGEILRWRRPLDGHELRTVFENLSHKWGIQITGPLDSRIETPLLARQLKGSNIIPDLVDLADDDPSASAWLNLWTRWNWDWISTSVQRAASLGANTIRLIGDVNAVHSGAIDEVTYHNRLQQVVSLCDSLGCKFYYCAIDLRHKREADPDFIGRFLAGVAALLARNKNVVAIELCNEVASGYQLYPESDVVNWITAWSKAIRASAPAIPLSISDVAPGTLGDKISATDYYAKYADSVDFFDLHVYEGLAAGPDSKILAPYELAVNRPLLIGEFGADRSVPGEQPGLVYANVRQLRDSSSLVAGALQWGAVNDDFGLYSESDGHLEEDISAEWAKF